MSLKDFDQLIVSGTLCTWWEFVAWRQFNRIYHNHIVIVLEALNVPSLIWNVFVAIFVVVLGIEGKLQCFVSIDKCAWVSSHNWHLERLVNQNIVVLHCVERFGFRCVVWVLRNRVMHTENMTECQQRGLKTMFQTQRSTRWSCSKYLVEK